ncbi:MAG: RluA family pseudouridine synthase [Muribaculaceae bacterium]|nr:RluA family pseudouridine synthase [Muribaculaceae bacterium]
MSRKPLSAKPGTQPGVFRPDNIENYTAPEGTDCGLLEFLEQCMPHRKRTTVKDYLKHHQVMLNGTVTTQFDAPVIAGATVSVNTTREFQVFTHPRLKLVYEDDDVIVIDKGYGLLSMGTDKIKDGTAYSIVREYIKRKDPRNKLFIVHRLDRDTTGLMMFAKSQQAKETMQHNWNNMVLERKYVAVVEGELEPEAGEIRSYLAENSEHEVYSTKNPEEGQLAVTYYTTLKKRAPYSLVELSLATGRKNQIRVHMKDSGHPIVGDRRYGAQASPIHRLCLHAQTLRFVHPVTRRDMYFTSPLPAGFYRLVGSLKFPDR